MTSASKTSNNIFTDIWQSLTSLPLWVQLWLALILGPINMASIIFIYEPKGLLIAILAYAALIPSMIAVFYQRGFTKLVAALHIIPWTILVLLIIFERPAANGLYDQYLWVLLGINLISLAFDYPDTIRWLKGERSIAGRS